MKTITSLIGPLLWTLASAAPAPIPHTFAVSSAGGNLSSPWQYGIMFEDINHSIDGGLYAELIMNRAFQATNYSTATVAPWYPIGGASLTIDNTNFLSSALPFSVKISGSSGQIGLANPGYFGMEVKPQVYSGSFYVKGSYKGSMTLALVSTTGTAQTFASTQIPVTSTSGDWTQITYQLTPPAPAGSVNNSLALTFDAATATDGSLNFNLLSLFPPTYNSRPNGMRIDLMDVLSGLNPSFLRWGGNNIEGNGIKNGGSSPLWRWNETVGDLKNRPGRLGTWGYFNTDGVGLNEVFEWCQDLDMSMLLTVWAGHYLDGTSLTEAEIQPYIQDTLDELEYILGDQTTAGGRLRASHGYPDPWKLQYVEIGNEDNLGNGTASYEAYRLRDFANAIKAAYPSLTIMSSYVTPSRTADEIGDYHTYANPDDFVAKFNLFDPSSPTNLSFIGEYAAVASNGLSVNYSAPLLPSPEWIGSVGEAVFLIGAERNSLWGASYAPSFSNLATPNISWSTDLVMFTHNTSQNVLTTSYRVINLLSNTRFTTTRPVTTIESFGPLYWVAGENTPVGQHVFKAAVYNASANVPVTVQFDGVAAGTRANLTILTGTSATASNMVDEAEAVVSRSVVLTSGEAGFVFELPDLSVAVLATFPSNSLESTYASELVKSGFGGYTGCSLGRSVVEGWGNGC